MQTPQGPRGLYLPDGSFRPFDAEALTSEIATRERAGDFLSLMGSHLGILPDPDPVLRARGDDVLVLNDLAADDQVTTAMLGRKNRVLNRRDYALEPGQRKGQQADADATLLCDRLTEDMERWDLAGVISGVLDAPYYGMTPLELLWRFDGGWWHLADVTPRPPEWFAYNAENELVWRGAAQVEGTPLPAGKFVVARHHPTYRNPYGLRLLSRCLWPVAFKKGGVTFYTTFLEKYGMPWAVGVAPARASRDEKRAMAADLARMVQDAVAVIPHGADVRIETPTGQVGDLHEAFLRRWDASISKVLMGQTLTVELDGKGGSRAASDTHKDVADDIAEADRRLVEAALNEIAWVYAQINRPAALAPLFAYSEPEDLLAKAQLDKTLTDTGVVFRKAHYERAYALDPEEFDVRQPDATPPGGATFPALFSSPRATSSEPDPEDGASLAELAQRTIDATIERHLPEALRANAAFVTQLEKAVQTAESWNDLHLLLAEHLGRALEPDALESLLTELMLASSAYGHAAAEAEEQGGA